VTTSIKETVERLEAEAAAHLEQPTWVDPDLLNQSAALIKRLAGALEEIKSADDQDVWLRGRAHRALSGEPT
jgi:hypothetical protein